MARQVVLVPLHVVVRIVIVDFAIQAIPSSQTLSEELVLMLSEVAPDMSDADDNVKDLGHKDECDGLHERLFDLLPIVQLLVICVILNLLDCASEMDGYYDR